MAKIIQVELTQNEIDLIYAMTESNMNRERFCEQVEDNTGDYPHDLPAFERLQVKFQELKQNEEGDPLGEL